MSNPFRKEGVSIGRVIAIGQAILAPALMFGGYFLNIHLLMLIGMVWCAAIAADTPRVFNKYVTLFLKMQNSMDRQVNELIEAISDSINDGEEMNWDRKQVSDSLRSRISSNK